MLVSASLSLASRGAGVGGGGVCTMESRGTGQRETGGRLGDDSCRFRRARLTGTRSPTRSGSKTWSARSLTGRESRVERKDLVKANSDMMGERRNKPTRGVENQKPLQLDGDASIVEYLAFAVPHVERSDLLPHVSGIR